MPAVCVCFSKCSLSDRPGTCEFCEVKITVPMNDFNALLDASLSTTMNELGAQAGLGPMKRAVGFEVEPEVQGIHPEGETHEGSAELCKQWAAYLGLSETHPRHDHLDGYRRWSGTCGGWELAVSAITSVELYNASYDDVR